MKLLFFILVASVLATLPFLILRKPWAIAIWRRARLIAVIYAIVVLAAGIVRLIFGWEDIYG